MRYKSTFHLLTYLVTYFVVFWLNCFINFTDIPSVPKQKRERIFIRHNGSLPVRGNAPILATKKRKHIYTIKRNLRCRIGSVHLISHLLKRGLTQVCAVAASFLVIGLIMSILNRWFCTLFRNYVKTK